MLIGRVGIGITTKRGDFGREVDAVLDFEFLSVGSEVLDIVWERGVIGRRERVATISQAPGMFDACVRLVCIVVFEVSRSERSEGLTGNQRNKSTAC